MKETKEEAIERLKKEAIEEYLAGEKNKGGTKKDLPAEEIKGSAVKENPEDKENEQGRETGEETKKE